MVLKLILLKLHKNKELLRSAMYRRSNANSATHIRDVQQKPFYSASISLIS